MDLMQTKADPSPIREMATCSGYRNMWDSVGEEFSTAQPYTLRSLWTFAILCSWPAGTGISYC